MHPIKESRNSKSLQEKLFPEARTIGKNPKKIRKKFPDDRTTEGKPLPPSSTVKAFSDDLRRLSRKSPLPNDNCKLLRMNSGLLSRFSSHRENHTFPKGFGENN